MRGVCRNSFFGCLLCLIWEDVLGISCGWLEWIGDKVLIFKFFEYFVLIDWLDSFNCVLIDNIFILFLFYVVKF